MQNSAEKQENSENHRKYKIIKCRRNEDQCRTVQKSKKFEKITENIEN